MTYAPRTLKELGAYWTAQGGVNLGIVGNAAHTRGYHLGKDRIFDGTGPGVGWSDYSVELARDKAGLSDAASAIDLGRLDGTLKSLRAFSRWLVAQCMASSTVRHDIREIIYSPDGSRVQRYSSVDNTIHTGPGNGDASHLTHTHISYYRDSVARDKVAVFAPYFTPAPEETVNSYPVPKVPSIGTVATGTWLYATSALEANPANVKVDPGRDLPYLGQPTSTYRIVEYVDGAGAHTGRAMFVKAPELLNIRAVTDASPFTQADIDAAEKAAAGAVRLAADTAAAAYGA